MTARTAAAILLILSGLLIAIGSVGVAVFVLTNPQWIDAQLVEAGATAEQLDLIRGPLLTEVVVASGILGAIEGGLSVVLGWFVRRGARWAIGTSIAMTALRLALVGFCALIVVAAVALGQPVAGGAANAVATIAAAAVLLANLVLLFVARRGTPPAMPG